jgi:hypothetical protein
VGHESVLLWREASCDVRCAVLGALVGRCSARSCNGAVMGVNKKITDVMAVTHVAVAQAAVDVARAAFMQAFREVSRALEEADPGCQNDDAIKASNVARDIEQSFSDLQGALRRVVA